METSEKAGRDMVGKYTTREKEELNDDRAERKRNKRKKHDDDRTGT